MRHSYAHDATLIMLPDGDVRAPGAAITVALCGHWEHQPPCPLAAHHTRADRVGDEVRLRILFAAAPADEPVVRERINLALAAGVLAGPDGVTTRWQLAYSGRADVDPAETSHAERLTRG